MKEMMKYISLLISIVMFASLITGCSSGEIPEGTTNNTDAVTASSESDDEVIIKYILKDRLVNPKEYVQTEGFIQYSVDYPSDYSLFRSNVYDDWMSAYFTTDNFSNYIFGVDSVSGVDYHASDILLSVYKIGSLRYDTLQDIHEHFISRVNKAWEDKIIEDTVWEYGNITGYRFVCLNWKGPNITKPEKTGKTLEELLEPWGFVRVIEEKIAFEYNGYFWEFMFRTPVENYEQQDEILEQVIESLAILE